jgi:hypothetical protein
MIPRPFDYHAPRTLPEAIGLLARYGDEAKLLAGGHSLLPMMKLRFAQPGHLIDLGKIAELKGIREEAGTLRIGAMTTENELIWSKLLQDKCPLLVEGARLISDPQVRYKGTIGGDISHGDPGNDHPALMIVLGASFVLKGGSGERVVPADGFFLGNYATLLEPSEIMTEIRVPIPAPGTGLGLRQAEAQGRRLRHRRRGGDAAHEGRNGAGGGDRPDQCRRLGPSGERSRGGAARQGVRRRRHRRGGASGDEHLRSGPRPARRCRIQDRRWPAR